MPGQGYYVETREISPEVRVVLLVGPAGEIVADYAQSRIKNAIARMRRLNRKAAWSRDR